MVIGPYRSGKSFTLNQLLSVGCDEGFGVGHTRKTQTKGVWVWGAPVKEKELNLLYFDTEGFESTGKADSYDDRIFALSTLISSVLIYNLPESIRESDVEKLSFAGELAKAFYSDGSSDGTSSDGDGEDEGGSTGIATTANPPIRPGSMLWLIQRDFLQGDTLQTTLKTALKQVPNPHNDPAIVQLNRIRQGLAAIAANSTALGLPQPHLDRTKLCEMSDDQLDQGYLRKREKLKSTVTMLAQPKVVKGKVLDGPALADLIEQVVTALNDREIPTAGSLVEYFNRELVDACREQFVKALERVSIPVETEDLNKAADKAKDTAKLKFEREKFGSEVGLLRENLESALTRELSNRQTQNTYESSQVCEQAEMECETALEKEANQKLPSTGRFQSRYDTCKTSFHARCVGPAKAHNEERLTKAWERESSRFRRDYNDRLFNGLVLLSVGCIVLFRFVFKWSLGETLGWGAFIFLQVYPKSFFGTGASMYESSWWLGLVKGWEMVVNNPVVDLGRIGWVGGGGLVIIVATRKRWVPSVKRCCCGGGRRKKKPMLNKDLDV